MVLKQIQTRQESQPPAADRLPLLKQALDRAVELAEEGNAEEAHSVWETAQRLYDDVPGARPLLEEARKQLEIPSDT
jgi:hypothetical protein